MQVANVWSTKFGIMLERATETASLKVGCSSESDMHSTMESCPLLPTVFALLHPLDEVSPVLAKHGKCVVWKCDICYVQTLTELHDLSKMPIVFLLQLYSVDSHSNSASD